MKKTLTLIGAVAVSLSLSAQVSFSDNFDALTAGTYIGPTSSYWTTWSGTEGGAEDAQANNTQAFSAPNSIYFSSTSNNGGPQDVILDFGGQHNTGQFNMSMMMYLVANKGGYFNFQANTTPGQLWALECYINESGAFTMQNTDGQLLTGTFPTASWFEVEFNINLNTNTWEVLVNNTSAGSFANTVNQIASMDIFPVNSTTSGGNGQAGFYIDDVSFSHTPYTLPALNGAAISLSGYTGLATQQKQVTATIRNLGTTAITSFDLALNYNSATVNQSVSSVNIASLATTTVTFTTPITLAAGNLPLSVTISNVNGLGADGDPSDDVKTVQVNPVIPAGNRIVVAEEGTGTWCQWCPRGAVFMDYMAENYHGFYAGIAVHNGDPMVNTVYDAGIGALIAGYPSALVDRGTSIDPSQLEANFIQRVVVPGNAVLVNGATWNATSRQLDVSVTYTFTAAATTAWKVGLVLTEDSVTGTGSQWAQSNAYAGGNNGVMGGFELLPNPVPASQMNYNHVAREITPGFGGLTNSFSAAPAPGDVRTFNFSYILPAGWDTSQIHLVGLLIDNTGRINNGSYTSIAEAVANGFVAGTPVSGVSVEEPGAPDAVVNLYPNPTNGNTFLTLNLIQTQEVQVIITDVTGRTVAARNYGELNGAWTLPVTTEGFAAGIYNVQVITGNNVETKRLVVE
ncbi:MAG: T9SS type A sorting domain-containing protein [Bacteroidetes bacterium]|nr:T9SS type A sorting domain-containing protein [Bacteroidota bacterium]